MEELVSLAESLGHSVIWYPFPTLACLSYCDETGNCYIGIDSEKVTSRADGRVKLAHELGHCETSAFYTRRSDAAGRARREERADRWAIRRLVPYALLLESIRGGCDTVWELAERFDVTESFIRKALFYYRTARGLHCPETGGAS